MTTAAKSAAAATANASQQHVLQKHLLDSDLFDDFDILDVDDGFDPDVSEFMGAHGLDADDFH